MNNRLAAVSFALIASLAIAAAASGQAVQHHGIPDPITTAELERYATRLMLSDQQRQAIQPLHGAYREQFTLLRENDIDRYVADLRAMRGAEPPGSAEWRQLEGRLNRIVSQIRSLDESLFAAIEPILSDEQMDRLPRVRQARHRVRLLPALLTSRAGIEFADLSALVLEIGLSAADIERIDPWIAVYEQRLMRMMEQLPPLLVGARRIQDDAGLEYQREAEENPDQRQAAFQRMRAQSHESQLPVQEHVVGIRVLGRKTLLDIMAHLSDGDARRLRERYLAQAYLGRLPLRVQSPVESALDEFRDRDDLDVGQREQIAELAAHLRHRVESIVREAMEAEDAFAATTTTFSRWIDGHREASIAHTERIDGFDRRIREVEAPIVEEVMASLPEEAFAMFAQMMPRGRHVAARSPSPAAPGPAADRRVPRRTIPPGGLVPAAISQRDIAHYARALDLDDEEREFMRELHEQYADRIAETAAEPALRARATYRPGDGDPEEFVANVTEARRIAIAAVEHADRAFFNALLAPGVLPDQEDAIERLRQSRERQRFVLDSLTRMRVVGAALAQEGDATQIDLSHMVGQHGIDLATLPAADQVLRQYERDLADLLRASFEASARYADSGTIAIAHRLPALQGGELSPEAQQRETEAYAARREATVDLARSESAIRQLHERTMEELLALLPEPDGAALQKEYRERLLPQVYRDPGAMEGALARSLQMEDLNSQQRERIAELLGEYQGQYLNLTESMHEAAMAIDEERVLSMQGESRQPDGFARLFEQFAKLQHERQELNARTIVRLKGVLSEQQLARLGPLPDPDPDARFRRMGH